jgi:hypothetical protein
MVKELREAHDDGVHPADAAQAPFKNEARQA